MTDNHSLIERAARRLAGRGGVTPLPPPGADPGAAPGSAPGSAPGRLVSVDPERLKALGVITADTCDSRLAEEMRVVKRRLMRRLRRQTVAPARDGHVPGVVTVSSARPREGKSTFALNLALSLALDDKVDTLLVDADLLHPRLFAMLALDPAAGVADVLRDPSLDPAALLCRDERLGLSLLDAGRDARATAEQFAAGKMRAMVERLARPSRDRLIIVDTAPLLMHTGALTLAQCAEQTVLVVEANRTEQSEVQTAIDLLDGTGNVSLVLNKVPADNSTEALREAYCYY
ncbi:MAG TPA: hypothetical protein VD995_31375 [Azospirillum sp.]|nr:hypothetical protein [Azospirillum sp.]